MIAITLLVGDRQSGKTTQLLKEHNRYGNQCHIGYVVSNQMFKKHLLLNSPIQFEPKFLKVWNETALIGHRFDRLIVDDMDVICDMHNKSVSYILGLLHIQTAKILLTSNTDSSFIFEVNKFCNDAGISLSIYSIKDGVLKLEKS
jgi:hypothetical protein